jgi:hypothetical protein
MKAKALACLGIVVLLATVAVAGEPRHQLSDGRGDVLHGAVVGAGKAARDTTYLLGGPGRLDGKFQDAGGNADWQGWTHVDLTYQVGQRWHVSSFHSPTGTPAMWCGQESFPSGCGPGYGNDWNGLLVFSHAAADPGVNTVVRLECIYHWDSEPAFDYFRIQQNRGGTWQTIVERDGVGTESFDQSITFTPSDYVGPAGDRLELRFQGISDEVWSDEDCLWDTDGLAQVDDIRVTIGAETFADDFNVGEAHHWTEVYPTGCGDFAKIWQGLQDIDPCASNYSPQAAFIDDGIVVPGTGGSHCITWCYGPGGYIVNPTGGLLGDPHEIDNLIVSPPVAWQDGYDGAILTYDVYRHEDLISGVSPNILYKWHVRSVNTGNPADLMQAPWEDRHFLYYGRNYRSELQVVSDLLVPERTHVQVALGCIDYGSTIWEYGIDGTPAPYFDNVTLKAFAFEGPAITAREIDLAQDDFPDRGVLDLANLANNWVRFDMARSISPDAHLRNDPGDSILVDIGLPRVGSVLAEMPKLVVKMKANPLFDGVRVLPASFTQSGDMVDGWVYGDSTWQANGALVPNRYHFDLPDSSFFFPGDVIHYYIEARDNVGGAVGVSTLPVDISAFGDFDGVFPYGGNDVFVVDALPTVWNGFGGQPRILFWNDAGNRGGQDEWCHALNDIALRSDYDVYYTNGPTSGVGNGLGGRATAATLAGYDLLLYTSGDLATFTIANGDYGNDPSNDLGVLDAWFQQGGKQAFLTGDDLAFSLGVSGSQALAFRAQHLGIQFVNNNLRPLIENQTAPTVATVTGNSIFTTVDQWHAYGGCPGINDFDAIEAGSAERLAEFLTSAGMPGYTYAAATRYVNVADVVFLPYDLSFVHDTNAATLLPARARILDDVLTAFGIIPNENVVAVLPAAALTVFVSPNPFNPRTVIALDLPRAGEVSLRVYDIRGRLVRTLHDGQLTEGRHELVWLGDDDAGRALASGVYFYEVRAAGEERIGKLALVR